MITSNLIEEIFLLADVLILNISLCCLMLGRIKLVKSFSSSQTSQTLVQRGIMQDTLIGQLSTNPHVWHRVT